MLCRNSVTGEFDDEFEDIVCNRVAIALKISALPLIAKLIGWELGREATGGEGQANQGA